MAQHFTFQFCNKSSQFCILVKSRIFMINDDYVNDGTGVVLLRHFQSLLTPEI